MEYDVKPNESVSRAVKRLIARSEDCHPSELGRLQFAVDVDELEKTVESSPADQEGRPTALLFRYCGYAVEVRSDRTITIAK